MHFFLDSDEKRPVPVKAPGREGWLQMALEGSSLGRRAI